MVCGSYNYSYWGESKPTFNWGASHCMVYDLYGSVVECYDSWFTKFTLLYNTPITMAYNYN